MPADVGAMSVAFEELLRLFRRLSPATGLSLTAAATLSNLERRGPARLTDLATQQGVSQPAMTQLVTRLQDAGLVVRAPDPDDGRVVLVHVTDAGRAELVDRREVRTSRLGALLDQLPADERAALYAALPAIESLTRLAAEPERQGARL
jgi:DNA-binding MarR family transcriptional regulator